MQLYESTWPEVEAYLRRSRSVIVPIGSIEQHGPNGLLGTDSICAELIAAAAGDLCGGLVTPTFNVGMAQHHMAFPGTITLRPSTMIAAIVDWCQSLTRHGFDRIYWLNGHGGNVAPIETAFSEVYSAWSLGHPAPPGGATRLKLGNWCELAGVAALGGELFPVGEGDHATATEVSVTFHAYPKDRPRMVMEPTVAPPLTPFHDAEDFRRQFADGRVGSDPSQASGGAGARLVKVAARALAAEFEAFQSG